ncbi:MAG TPA: tetratricopeptide repeat protein [Phycisphaerae bacterium]|nr:tetratricopeptide repeat protein [Phycisphaerae bacterium]HRW52153.1 tetratricopeptide repeat protein [Phycisphaerae bacterium]
MARKSSKQIRREEKARRKQEQGEQRTSVPDAPILVILALGFVLASMTAIAYSNSYDGKFVYDDTKWVQQMSVDRIDRPIRSIFRARRPVVDATLSLNYSVAEMTPAPRDMTVPEIPSPYGYHVVNLIIHILAGLTLFGLVRRTIRIGPFGDSVKASAHWIAFCVALLWLLHPLQTQSVTYIIQRAESLMGLFYLLTLYCLLRFATTSNSALRALWLVGVFLAAVLGMGSKAVMVTVPVVALIYDRVFLASSWNEVISKRWMAHACIVASLGVLMYAGVVRGVLFPSAGKKSLMATVGFGLSDQKHLYHVSPAEYLLTEAKVIPRYLKLTVLPTDQALDYKMEKVDPRALTMGELFTQSLLPGLFVLALLGATIVGLIRKPWLGFIGVWFFVILAPTSSFIPIRDPIYEHRVYLSIAAALALFVIGVWQLLAKFGGASVGRLLGPACAGVCLVPAVVFACLTFERNKLYHDPLLLWEDNVAKVPDNWRARNNLGKQYLDEADSNPAYLDKAIEQLRLCVEENPTFVNGWYNLGNAYARTKDYDNAINAYQNALKSNPIYTVAQIMLGNAFTDKSIVLSAERKRDEATAALEEAAKAFATAAPTARKNTTNDKALRARAYYNLGNTYWRILQLNADRLDLLDKARAAYRSALEAQPSHQSARIGIGLTYLRERDHVMAIEAFEEGLKYNPPQSELRVALIQLGNAYFAMKRYKKAIPPLIEATRRFPEQTTAWLQLARCYQFEGRMTDAIETLKSGAAVCENPETLQRALQNLERQQGS